MSLDWNAKKVKEWDNISETKRELVIYFTMFLGMNEITEKTLWEWCFRAKVYNGVFSEWADKECTFLADENEMSKFIGLRTNASREPASKWFNRHYKISARQAKEAKKKAA